MDFRKIHIAILLVVINGFSSVKTLAQSQFASFDDGQWATVKSAPANDKILLSIESLKKAEASISDSTIALRLESLGYLAIANSGFTSSKTDKYQRSGWWMLSYAVATKYGLIINSIIDERKDLKKSTLVASAYWLDLKAAYGSSKMADLIFARSPIAVAKYYNDSINYPNGFAQIRSEEKLLKEIKSLYESQKLKKYIGPIQPVSLVKSSQKISFQSLHHFTQIPTTELENLNPQWVSNTYDPHYGELLLPSNYEKDFAKQLQAMEQKTRDDQIVLVAANEKRMKLLKGDIPDLERYKPIRYKVKMGDNLGRISQRYHVKTSSIRSWNELSSDRIYAGQRLTIYIPKNQKIAVAKPAPKKAKKSKLKVGEYQEYTVQTGDTLWGISQQFDKISADTIMEDNGIDENISPGQVLKIRNIE